MKNSERLRLAWGYWIQCNGVLFGIVILSLLLSLASAALGLFPLVFGGIVFTNKMLDWRSGKANESGIMLDMLPLSNRDRKIILIFALILTWIVLVGGCSLLMNLHRPGFIGILLWAALSFCLMYGWIVINWEKEKYGIGTWKTMMIYIAMTFITVIAAQEISKKTLIQMAVLVSSAVIILSIGLTRLDLYSKKDSLSQNDWELPGISEPLCGILDLAEIEFHGHHRSRSRNQIFQLLIALAFLVLLSGSYVYLVFFVTDFAVSWQLTKRFQGGGYAVNLIPASRRIRLAGQLIGQAWTLGCLWIFNLLILGIQLLIPLGSGGLPLTLDSILISICATLAFVAYSLTFGSGYRQDSGTAYYFLGFFVVNLCASGASVGKLPFLQSGLFWVGLLILSLILTGRWLAVQARRGTL